MNKAAKEFILGLEQCRPQGGMEWYGKIPNEIVEFFDISIDESRHGYYIAGVYVKPCMRFKPFKPDFEVSP